MIFFQISVMSRDTEILIESNYWLGMNVPFIFKRRNPYKTVCYIHIHIFLNFFFGR